MEENKQEQSYTDQIIQLAGKNCTGVTSAKEYVFTKEELLWFVNDLSNLGSDSQIQSLQQQNAEQAAQLKLAGLMHGLSISQNDSCLLIIKDQSDRIAELEKQLKEAQKQIIQKDKLIDKCY